MKVLVTGGAGYIGSHAVVSLLDAGHDVVVLDNLCNASPKVLPAISAITGKAVDFYQADVQDAKALRRVFGEHQIDAVMHFAGLKSVGESVADPVRYYQNNVGGSLVLAEEMLAAGVFHLVFSSSATVYGDPQTVPIDECAPIGATTNPYGTSKYMVERMLADVQRADSRFNVMLLRYFNPVGAHQSGQIGECPNGIPNNLMPYISQVAVGKLECLSVFGDDYDTIDGSGVRDYIHVVDLAEGHLAALDYLKRHPDAGVTAVNLGTGQGTSVLQLVHAFEQATGEKVPYRITDRRAGDIAACYASCQKAKSLLGWQARLGIDEMCADTWRWQSMNPDGYV